MGHCIFSIIPHIYIIFRTHLNLCTSQDQSCIAGSNYNLVKRRVFRKLDNVFFFRPAWKREPTSAHRSHFSFLVQHIPYDAAKATAQQPSSSGFGRHHPFPSSCTITEEITSASMPSFLLNFLCGYQIHHCSWCSK